jgi:predicted transporter
MEAGIIVLLVFVAAIYCLPMLVAHQNKKRNADAIALLNLLLGWTFIGWVAALIWAVSKDAPPVAIAQAPPARTEQQTEDDVAALLAARRAWQSRKSA